MLQPFGIEVDDAKNEVAVGVEAEVQTVASRVKVLVIPTDEELEIAQQALALLGSRGDGRAHEQRA